MSTPQWSLMDSSIRKCFPKHSLLVVNCWPSLKYLSSGVPSCWILNFKLPINRCSFYLGVQQIFPNLAIKKRITMEGSSFRIEVEPTRIGGLGVGTFLVLAGGILYILLCIAGTAISRPSRLYVIISLIYGSLLMYLTNAKRRSRWATPENVSRSRVAPSVSVCPFTLFQLDSNQFEPVYWYYRLSQKSTISGWLIF